MLNFQEGTFPQFFQVFLFISHAKQNNSSFNYVKTNRGSLLFTFFCTNFNAFLIPPHWLVNQPLQLLLLYNAFQSFLINPDLKMVYHYLYEILEMDSLPELLGFCSTLTNESRLGNTLRLSKTAEI